MFETFLNSLDPRYRTTVVLVLSLVCLGLVSQIIHGVFSVIDKCQSRGR
jgi:hypothetical protein